MKRVVCTAVLVAAAVAAPPSHASSHREAPNIMLDPSADNTDTYAFTAKDAPDALTVVANWVPGGNPANGPNFFRFDDRARYYINFDNTGDGKPDIRDRYRFHTVFSNTSYLYAQPGVESFEDPKLQTRQTYSIVREQLRNGKRVSQRTLARGLPVAPSNTGPKTFPNYTAVADQAIKMVGRDKLFVGQRNDAFFIDLGNAFDNINERQGPLGNTGGGVDTQSGTSIQTITAQIPEEELTRDHKRVSGPDASDAVVGVWASTERKALEVTNKRYNNNRRSRGKWVQVSRLGNPLVNELFVPAGLKDAFNAHRPSSDNRRIRRFILDPELARQLNTLVPTGLGAPESNRDDLVKVFLTGMPGLNQFKGQSTPADTLKINLGIPPAQTPNRFGVLGGDNAGFPNGRRLEDDATDIVVQLAAGFFKNNPRPLGDGVDQDDQAFLDTFPYQSVPNNGFANPVSDRTEPAHAPFAPGNNPPTPIGPR